MLLIGIYDSIHKSLTIDISANMEYYNSCVFTFYICSKFVSNVAYSILGAYLFQFEATNKIGNCLTVKSLISTIFPFLIRNSF